MSLATRQVEIDRFRVGKIDDDLRLRPRQHGWADDLPVRTQCELHTASQSVPREDFRRGSPSPDMIDPGDVVPVTRLDRLAPGTCSAS